MITAGEDKVIVIMELPKEQRAEYHRQSEALVQKLGQELPEALADGIGVYGGTVAEDLAQISISYENAMLMQLYQEKDGSRNIIWYEKQKQVNTYPTEEKCRALLHQVLKGDVENVYQTFADVIEEYFIQGSLNPYLQNLLLDELQINLVRIMDILRVSDNEYQDSARDWSAIIMTICWSGSGSRGICIWSWDRRYTSGKTARSWSCPQ